MDYTGLGEQDVQPYEAGQVLRTPEGSENETTGRFLVLLPSDATAESAAMLATTAGVHVASSSDFGEGAVDVSALGQSEAVIFEELGVAVVDGDPSQIMALGVAAADTQTPLISVEPERVVYAIPNGGSQSRTIDTSYVRGYRDAVASLSGALLGGSDVQSAAPAGPTIAQGSHTWGLQATNVVKSSFTGDGIRVAVLDTGFATGHPDFAGRDITAQSFVPGEDVNDLHGHGTHCIGTACGPRDPGSVAGYGVASGASIFAGKVLNNQGRGNDLQILAGITWAIRNRCAVASMSLGARVLPGQLFTRAFEAAGRRAARAGTLVIAAAGNDSSRPGVVFPVAHPANCPSILAVAAVDDHLQIAPFSNGGLERHGGQVDVAGPGVGVLSAWPAPRLHHTISGTSMATPHVAGIAALYAEANPDMRGAILAWLLFGAARRLALPSREVGVGLVQAP